MIFKIMFLILVLCSMSHGKTAVLILARGGSKGIRMKNLQKVGGINLLSRAITTARSAGLQDVTVSTNHPLIALQALKDNASVLRRSFITATDSAPSIWGALEFLELRPDVNILILLQTTSPFTRPSQLREALQLINYPKPYDCVFSATRSYKLRWRLIKGKVYPVNFNIERRIRRQDWSGELLETGAFYITRRAILVTGKFQNNNCTVFEVSAKESLEIDSVEDLQLANILFGCNFL